MTEDQQREAIKKMIRDHTAQMIAEGPEACRAWLISTGIYDKDGNLTPQYGGK